MCITHHLHHQQRVAKSIMQDPCLLPPTSVYANAAGTRAVDDKAVGTLKPLDANAEQDPPSSAASDQQQRRYYRRLIRRRYMDLDEAANDPDLQGNDIPDSVWYQKLYGPDIKVITTIGVPPGWILVDRKIPFPHLCFCASNPLTPILLRKRRRRSGIVLILKIQIGLSILRELNTKKNPLIITTWDMNILMKVTIPLYSSLISTENDLW